MLRLVATVGCLGLLPGLGGILAAALGVALAGALFLATRDPAFVLAGWCLAFALAAWALPRAAGVLPDRTVVIDRVVGAWLAAAPAIPATALAAEIGPGAVALVLGLPLALYLALLAGPLRALGRRPGVRARMGDDLIAGGVTTLASLAALALLVVRAGGIGA
jgi:phosphatidylglycerophosphatase A